MKSLPELIVKEVLNPFYLFQVILIIKAFNNRLFRSSLSPGGSGYSTTISQDVLLDCQF